MMERQPVDVRYPPVRVNRGHAVPRASPKSEDPASLQSFDVLGVHVSATTLSGAVRIIAHWIQTDAREYVCVSNVHDVMQAWRDPSLRAGINDAGMVTPDGMPLVWLGRLRGAGEIERVYGPDLMLALLRRSEEAGYRHFFYGGGPGVVERLVERLMRRFPRLQVAGAISPPFGPPQDQDDERYVEQINEARADVVWVGLGCPKQNWWMLEHRARLDAPVLVGVGAAFDFHAGVKRQAPRWMQRSGLEWGFRLVQEPRRLWRRYLVLNSLFVLLLVRELLCGRMGQRAVP